MVKNTPANARDAGDMDSIPGSGRSPEGKKENSTYSSILAWKIPLTEEPGGLQFVGAQTDTTEHI